MGISRMSWILTIIVLSFTFTNLSEAKHGKLLPSAVVVGTVYCDTCFQEDFSKTSHFISGALVAVECRGTSSKPSFHQEAKTNEHGEFKVHLPFSVSKHVKRIKNCSVKLISSSEPYCSVASTATSSSALHLKSRNQKTHIFSAGFFTFKPLKQPTLCNQKPSLHSSKKSSTTFPVVPKLPPAPKLPNENAQIPFLPSPPPVGVPFFPPNPFQPPSILPPNPLLPSPPSILPPNPLLPSPPSILPPNPLLPSPPSIFPPNPFQPSPPSIIPPNPLQPSPPPFFNLPPIPGFTPPSPPPPAFPIPLPPVPLLPPLPPVPLLPPIIPGIPPASSSKNNQPSIIPPNLLPPIFNLPPLPGFTPPSLVPALPIPLPPVPLLPPIIPGISPVSSSKNNSP